MRKEPTIMAKAAAAKAPAKAAKDTKSDKPKEKKLPQKKVRKRNQVLKGPNGGMQLVLVEDVTHLGKQGDVVEVKHGYGRNYLLPYGLAVVPDVHNMKRLDAYKIKVKKALDARIADLKVLGEQLSRMPAFTMEANATDDGHLYGSIGPVEISKHLKAKNLNVDPDMVKMEHPIKEANILSEVPLILGHGIESKIQVLVVALAKK
jgi:large subunit ribosomal protein L9